MHLAAQGGWTPLHAAQDKNRVDIGRLLIKSGADPDIQGDVSLLLFPLCGTLAATGVVMNVQYICFVLMIFKYWCSSSNFAS